MIVLYMSLSSGEIAFHGVNMTFSLADLIPRWYSCTVVLCSCIMHGDLDLQGVPYARNPGAFTTPHVKGNPDDEKQIPKIGLISNTFLFCHHVTN